MRASSSGPSYLAGSWRTECRGGRWPTEVLASSGLLLSSDLGLLDNAGPSGFLLSSDFGLRDESLARSGSNARKVVDAGASGLPEAVGPGVVRSWPLALPKAELAGGELAMSTSRGRPLAPRIGELAMSTSRGRPLAPRIRPLHLKGL